MSVGGHDTQNLHARKNTLLQNNSKTKTKTPGKIKLQLFFNDFFGIAESFFAYI